MFRLNRFNLSDSGQAIQNGVKIILKSFIKICIVHGRRKVHDYFLLLPCKSSIFKIIIYIFNTSKFAANYVISIEVYDDFIGQKTEAMKSGKLAIRPWLSCPYNEHMLVDLPSSVVLYLMKQKKLL